MKIMMRSFDSEVFENEVKVLDIFKSRNQEKEPKNNYLVKIIEWFYSDINFMIVTEFYQVLF